MPDLDERRSRRASVRGRGIRATRRASAAAPRAAPLHGLGRGLAGRSRAPPWRGSAAGRCRRSAELRGASALRSVCQKSGPGKYRARSPNTMCGSSPLRHWPENSERSSSSARPWFQRRLTHGDARGVPAPLVWIQLPRRARARARASSRRARLTHAPRGSCRTSAESRRASSEVRPVSAGQTELPPVCNKSRKARQAILLRSSGKLIRDSLLTRDHLQDKMAVDPQQPIPLYFQLKTLLLEEILGGQYGPRRPPADRARALCAASGSAARRSRRALSELAEEGVILRHRRRGSFVNPHWLSRRPDQPEVRVVVPAEGPWAKMIRDAAGDAEPVSIVKVPRASLHQMLTHAVAEGVAPDLAIIDSVWTPEFAAAGFLHALEDLDEAWIRGEHEVDFLEPLAELEPVRRPNVRHPRVRGRGRPLVPQGRARATRPPAPRDLGRASRGRARDRRPEDPAPDRHARRVEGRRDDGVLSDRIPRLERCAGAAARRCQPRLTRDGPGAAVPPQPRRGRDDVDGRRRARVEPTDPAPRRGAGGDQFRRDVRGAGARRGASASRIASSGRTSASWRCPPARRGLAPASPVR